MTQKRSSAIAIVAGVAVASLIAVGLVAVIKRPHEIARAPGIGLTTPPGILLQVTKGRFDPGGVYLPGPQAFADANNTFAYILGTACDEACRADWAPVKVPPGAAAFGDWSIVDGANQWAFKGHPLYVPRAPKEDAAYKICAPDRNAQITDTCVALFRPAADVVLPDGIGIRELAGANGIALTDHTGLTLYSFEGDVAQDGQSCLANPCSRRWSPLDAPALALPRGDFTTVKRPDGTKQWAFKGLALYTYQGDTAPDDVTGANIDARWRVALIAAYATPPGISVGFAPGFGTIWTDAAKMTIYSHHRGGDRRRGQGRLPFPPDLNCDAACLQDWKPVTATAGAQPSGYWTLKSLSDGAQQWLYRGLPLYTYRGDTKPGDLKGEYIYTSLERDPDGRVVKIAAGNPPYPSRDVVPNFWRPAFPY